MIWQWREVGGYPILWSVGQSGLGNHVLHHDTQIPHLPAIYAYDPIYLNRRHRKRITHFMINRLLMQQGHYLEGASSAVPQWDVHLVGAFESSLIARIPAETCFVSHKLLIREYDEVLYYRRRRKALNRNTLGQIVHSLGGILR